VSSPSEAPMARAFDKVCELAEGGMGRVDLVVRRESGFARLYAQKRLHGQHREDHYFRAMFVDEARIAGLIRHANVVSVLDVGEDEDGPFLLMDYVEGVPLSELLHRMEERDERMPVQLCARIGAQIAHGLHAAHELESSDGERLQLVHRDVSPPNVLIGYDGVARVTDFGIAKALGQSTRTATGVLKGKFGYMSPEQLRYQEPDRRSDLFSLGVVLYELTSGERLYRNTDGMDGVRRILDEPPPDIGEVRGDVPPELVEILFELLAKEKEARPSSALEVALRLESVAAQLSAAEGPLDLGAFVRELFAARRDRERARIAEAMRRLGSEGTGRSSSGVVLTAPPRAGAMTRARWGVGIAIAATTIVAGSWLARTPAAQSPEPPSKPTTITLSIDSDPRDARVRIGGEDRGRTPLEIQVVRGDAALPVVIDKEGFAHVQRSVLPRADQTLHVLLTPAASATASAPSPPRPTGHWRPRVVPDTTPSAAPSASSGPMFRRFD